MPAQSGPSSALAQQLSSISLAWARDHGGSRGASATATRRPSLLYDAAAAADIDLATVYEVGLSGESTWMGRKEAEKGEEQRKKANECRMRRRRRLAFFFLLVEIRI